MANIYIAKLHYTHTLPRIAQRTFRYGNFYRPMISAAHIHTYTYYTSFTRLSVSSSNTAYNANKHIFDSALMIDYIFYITFTSHDTRAITL